MTEQKQTLLLVDDEQIDREILASYLKFGGYEVFQADNGFECLKMLDERTFDLVLLDVQMPVMNGFETLEKIKKEPAFKDIPVIFMTNLDMPNLQVKGLEGGALHYLIKPVNKAVLLATIKSVLKNSVQQSSSEITSNLNGLLKDYPLSELLQSMELSGKKAEMLFKDMDGVICVDNGEIIFVKQGKFTGLHAFSRLMFLNEGRFEINLNSSCEKSEQSFKIMHLLMDTARETDELNLILKELPDLNSLIFISEDIENFGILFGDLKFPLPLKHLITKMPDSLYDNVNLLIDLNINGNISVKRDK